MKMLGISLFPHLGSLLPEILAWVIPLSFGFRHCEHPRYPWCPWSSASTTIGVRGARRLVRTKLQVLLVSKGFFENFAPPFPEKELRDGTQKKSKNKY
jgi:hypothetical protein